MPGDRALCLIDLSDSTISGDGQLAPTAFRTELNQIWALPAKQRRTQLEQKTQVLKVVANTFGSVMQDQAMQVGHGVAKGTEKFAVDIVELGVATVKTTLDVAKASIGVNNRLNKFDNNLKSNPTQAMEDLAQAGVETANALAAGKHLVHTIDKLGNNVVHYAKETTAGTRNPINDLRNAAVDGYQRWDDLSTEKKAELGTELLLGLVPLERAATATKAIMGAVRSLHASRMQEIRALSHEIDEGLAVRDTWFARYKRRTGAGGNWPVINERLSSDVVKQCHRNACVAACGEMLTNGAIDQQTLVKRLAEYWTVEWRNEHLTAEFEWLAKELGPGWKDGVVEKSDQTLNLLMQRGSWAAELFEPAGPRYRRVKPAHAVVVDGVNSKGHIMIRDPAEGTKYEMTRKDFLYAWDGNAVWRESVK